MLKCKAYIDTKITPFTYVIEVTKVDVIMSDNIHKSKSSARRAAIRVADMLKLDLEWVDEPVEIELGKSVVDLLKQE
jgi:hypothetical protein